MENNILQHRLAVQGNIEKAFDVDFEKGRTGVYSDNAKNRRLNRVGQQYGHKKEQEQIAGGEKSGKKEESTDHAKHAAGASDEVLRRAAADENADEKVRNAAKEELKNRGKGGEDKGDENKEKKENEREKRYAIKDIVDNGSNKKIDSFMDKNTEYFKDVLESYGVKDLFGLQDKIEEEHEDDEKDPYGYKEYSKIYVKCLKQIPAKEFKKYQK
jgi:hypothetical protein